MLRSPLLCVLLLMQQASSGIRRHAHSAHPELADPALVWRWSMGAVGSRTIEMAATRPSSCGEWRETLRIWRGK